MKLRKRRDILSGVTIEYAKRFPEIPRPGFADTLKFPSDVTSLTGQNISELHGKYTMLYAYALHELAMVNVAIIRLNTEEATRRSVILRDRPYINNQERWKRDSVLDSDQQVLALSDKLALKKAEREVAQMYVSIFEKYVTALSRELSRKMKEPIV